MQKNTTPQPRPAAGAIEVGPIIAKARSGLPANLQGVYDKAVLSGMRIMFDKASFQMTMDELKQPGPLATRIANGVIKLVYLLWTQSNKTLPPQIIVPVTLTLALKAFEFMQMVQDPEATKEVLGDATHQAVQGVMDRFGVDEAKLPALVKANQGRQQVPRAPQVPQGMLDSAQQP